LKTLFYKTFTKQVFAPTFLFILKFNIVTMPTQQNNHSILEGVRSFLRSKSSTSREEYIRKLDVTGKICTVIAWIVLLTHTLVYGNLQESVLFRILASIIFACEFFRWSFILEGFFKKKIQRNPRLMQQGLSIREFV